VVFRLGKEVAHSRRADTDEHFDKIRPAQAEKRNVGFARNCLGQEGLPRSGGAHQQHPLRDAAAQGLVFFRRLEEVHDLAQLGDGFIDPGHVLESDVQVFLSVELVPAPPKGQRRSPAEQPADEQKTGHAHRGQQHKRQYERVSAAER